MAELKIFDPNRKDFLLLPSAHLKVWMAYWSHQNDDDEAYPSTARLMKSTGLSNNTVIDAKEQLVMKGWLVRVTGYASDRYSKPTRGSHQVAIYRVDDPTKDGLGTNHLRYDKSGNSAIAAPIQSVNSAIAALFPVHSGETVQSLPMQKLHTRFMSVSVSNPLSLPESVSLAVAVPLATSFPATPGVSKTDHQYNDPSLREGKTKTTTTATTTAKTTATTLASGSIAAAKGLKHNAKYDAPFPYDFDTWSQDDRTRWCGKHSVKSLNPSIPCSTPKTTRTTPPGSAVPPPVGDGDYGLHRCEHCTYAAMSLTKLADHVMLLHPDAALLPVLVADN